jgi:hypothetical protein
MKVVKIKHVEDCFDGSFIKEVLFDEIVTSDFIHHLRKTGELQYFPTFARPFYKLDAWGEYILKGVEGNNTARLILDRKNIEKSLSHFRDSVMSYREVSQADLSEER